MAGDDTMQLLFRNETHANREYDVTRGYCEAFSFPCYMNAGPRRARKKSKSPMSHLDALQRPPPDWKRNSQFANSRMRNCTTDLDRDN
jgi:hypothetical protein